MLFYERQIRKKEAQELPLDVSSVLRSLHEGGLLLKLDTFAGPREIYECECIKKSKTSVIEHLNLIIDMFCAVLLSYIWQHSELLLRRKTVAQEQNTENFEMKQTERSMAKY
jgi:hypothetical protein